MGQKAHPYGLRLGYIKPWKARWFATKNLPELLEEDIKLRKYLKDKLGHAGISTIEIERSSNRVRIRIFTARPGVIIGRRGQEIDKIKEDLFDIAKKEVFVDIKEVKNPQTDAQLVAENVALQLEKRIGFRRAMKKTIQMCMSKGGLGIKVMCKGRLGGSEIARHETYKEGKIPLSTFRADVDYGFTEAMTTYGTIGCKVWIYKGDILVKKELAEKRREQEKKQEEFEQKLAEKAGVLEEKRAQKEADDKKEALKKEEAVSFQVEKDEGHGQAASQAPEDDQEQSLDDVDPSVDESDEDEEEGK